MDVQPQLDKDRESKNHAHRTVALLKEQQVFDVRGNNNNLGCQLRELSTQRVKRRATKRSIGTVGVIARGRAGKAVATVRGGHNKVKRPYRRCVYAIVKCTAEEWGSSADPHGPGAS
jgi:hypothetical protein